MNEYQLNLTHTANACNFDSDEHEISSAETEFNQSSREGSGGSGMELNENNDGVRMGIVGKEGRDSWGERSNMQNGVFG